MKKQSKFLLVIIMMFTLVLTTTNYKGNEYKTSELINITNCSSSFMNKYFEEVGKIDDEDKENILIVTSKTKMLDTYGATKTIAAPNNQYILVYSSTEAKDKALDKLTSAKGILTVEENIIYKISAFNSWGVTSTGMDVASNIIEQRTGKENVVVAIIDTGLDTTLFKNKYPNKLAGTYNALNGSTSSMSDENGHGTHIAGTIAESTPSNVKILPAKASNGSTLSSTDIIAAINYIVYNEKADVINMSFGSYTPHEATRQAIIAAHARGIICVAAAGNEATAQTAYPAGYDETIAVSAVNSSNALADFSNVGRNITFAAPGVSIKSINATMSGTSMAAPHVAAAAAIIKSYDIDCTTNELIDILKSNAVDLGTPGWDFQFGYGVISFKNFKYCECNCTTCKSISCDGCSCTTCIHKDLTKNLTSISVSKTVLEKYNYGSISNLANTELKLNYSSGSLIKKISELEEVTISGYDPYKYTSQTITIFYAGKSTQVTLPAIQQPESFWTYVLYDGKAQLYDMEDVPVKWLHLPEKVGGYTVDSIVSGLFRNKDLTIVTMPNTITTIGAEAFAGSTVREIRSKASALTLGEKAFSNATNLIGIDANLIFEGNDTFEECYSLKTARIDSSNTKIPYGTFYNCTNLELTTIPDNAVAIEDYAYTNTKLKSAYIPAKVTSIGKYAFANCFNLTTLTIKEGVKTIGEGAFLTNSNLSSLAIPSTVTNIGYKAFRNCTGLGKITVAEGNTNYDSRENCNALIETSTNTLLIGTYNTITIPSTVKVIDEMAFAFNQLLYAIELSEDLTTIKSNAFYGVSNLIQVLTSKKLTSIATGAFDYTPTNLTFWVYSDSYAKIYASANNRHYRCYDPYETKVYGLKTSYVAFETIAPSDIYLIAKYEDYDGTRSETISSGITIEYQNGNTSLRATDTHIIIGAYNNIGYYLHGNVTVTVNKANPSYTVPTGLSATEGQKLSEVVLPSGFSWMSPDTVISGTGNKTYLATYTPTDTTNYNVIKNISITVAVVATKIEIIPTITIKDKVYDGTLGVDSSTVSVAELKSGEYTIEDITLSSANVGNVIATVRIKLTDAKFKTTSFPNKKQDYEATVNVKILPATVKKPVKTSKVYVYTGKEQELEITGFNNNIMTITGNKKTTAGEQMAVIKLANSNYIWEDGTTTEVNIIWNINRADIVYTAADTHYLKDGKEYGIEINVTSPTNAIIRYANENGSYTLSTMPKYSEAGTYVIKFKIYLNDNYNEVYDERKVYIYKDGIVNNTKDKEVIYDGLEHTLTMDINVGDVVLKYSVGNTEYDLDTLPMFKNVGEYTINYKIEKDGFATVYGSNKLHIYGIKKTDSKIRISENLLKVKNFSFSFDDISKRITMYAPKYQFEHMDRNQNTKLEDKVLTGEYIGISLDGFGMFRYRIIVLGDADCDGKISALDYVTIKNHIMGTSRIKDELPMLSADADDDGKISALDYVSIKNHIMNGGK
ncbi:MAG: leucine-rich repeat protein [Clostridia bacterium]|nr:leucine-rich repeat protein [Clostridia bacterium]